MYKVMIVEDDPTVRRGLCGTIRWEELRCQVAGEAGNGEEGLELAEKIAPDIIITAYGDFSYAQSAIRLGVSDYLLKPLKDGAIEEAVLAITRKERPAAETAPVLPDFDPDKHFKAKYVEEALDFIRRRYREDINIGMVASYLDLSEGYLSRILKRETGYSFTEYLTNYRICRAMEYLKDCRMKVYEAAELVGYQDTAYFSSQFKKVVGISPSEYQSRCR